MLSVTNKFFIHEFVAALRTKNAATFASLSFVIALSLVIVLDAWFEHLDQQIVDKLICCFI